MREAGRAEVTDKLQPIQQATAEALLVTKLTTPPWRANMLERWLLCQRLDEVHNHKLTLLSAPAGFGKTTLLTNWAAHNRVAWVSLDSSENDPSRFWRYLVAACQQVYPPLEKQIAPLLHWPGPLSIAAVLTALVNTLAEIDQ